MNAINDIFNADAINTPKDRRTQTMTETKKKELKTMIDLIESEALIDLLSSMARVMLADPEGWDKSVKNLAVAFA